MSVLYKSASGREVTHASSSSIDQYRLCRRKFYLSRIQGWRQKDHKASLEFGKCVESGVQYFFANGQKLGDSVEEFRRLWAKWIDQPLTYTEQEGNWADLNTMGIEGLRLFEITLPSLPIRNPKFQLKYEKELWAGDPKYGGLKYTAYIDMLSILEDGTRLITDIKTAKSLLPVTSNMIALDGQLRKYAWVSGITDVSFLNFVKCRPDDFRKGTNITLLEDCAYWKAGSELVVAKFTPPKDDKPWQMLVGAEDSVRKMDEALDAISGKGATERKEQVVAQFLADGLLGAVQRESVTKVKLQFVRGQIPESELPEIGDQIGMDMVAMKSSHDRGLYPADGGVRFPNNACTFCEFNPICLKNDQRRDETLYRIAPAAKEEDWLAELEETE